jgi:hypothetical protein
MIMTPAELAQARQNWISAGGDADLFDDAASLLDTAICQADVSIGLKPASFTLKRLVFRSAWRIEAAGRSMMVYRMTEWPTYADVEILP